MGWPVVVVDSGGIPVIEAANGLGAPVSLAANGLGTAVTIVTANGIPVVGSYGPLSPDHVFLRGQESAGIYAVLSGLNADSSRSNLQGKTV